MLVMSFSEDSKNKLIIQASKQYRKPGAQTLGRTEEKNIYISYQLNKHSSVCVLKNVRALWKSEYDYVGEDKGIQLNMTKCLTALFCSLANLLSK